DGCRRGSAVPFLRFQTFPAPLGRSHFVASFKESVKEAEITVAALKGHIDDFAFGLQQQLTGDIQAQFRLPCPRRSPEVPAEQPAEMGPGAAAQFPQLLWTVMEQFHLRHSPDQLREALTGGRARSGGPSKVAQLVVKYHSQHSQDPRALAQALRCNRAAVERAKRLGHGVIGAKQADGWGFASGLFQEELTLRKRQQSTKSTWVEGEGAQLHVA